MKKAKTASLSRKLFSSFVISFLLPMVLVSCLVSYLFSSRQYREIHHQATNNMKLISACFFDHLPAASVQLNPLSVPAEQVHCGKRHRQLQAAVVLHLVL